MLATQQKNKEKKENRFSLILHLFGTFFTPETGPQIYVSKPLHMQRACMHFCLKKQHYQFHTNYEEKEKNTQTPDLGVFWRWWKIFVMLLGYLTYNLWLADWAAKCETKLRMNVNRTQTEQRFSWVTLKFSLNDKLKFKYSCPASCCVSERASDGISQFRPIRMCKGGQQIQEKHMETFSSHH